MRRLNINHRLVVVYTMAALLCGASLSATAQTTTTTLTPAQQQAKAQALAKQQQAADARAKAQAAAKAKAAQTSQATPAVQNAAATTAKPATMFNPAQPAAPATMFTPAQPVATATTVPATTASGASATQAKPSWWNNLTSSSGGGGAASGGGSSTGGGSSSGADSMNRSAGGNGIGAGIGTFQWDRSSVNAYGCLRSGTRVFCDFDEFNQSPVQTGAGGIYSRITLVLSGGRIAGVSKAVFVGADGSTFPNAQLDPSVAVRTMLEYDDIPETETTVKLSFNNKEISNVSITPMNLQDNGNPAPRSAAGGQKTAGTSAAGQTGTAAAPQSSADKAQAAVTNVQTQKSTWGNVLSQAKSIGH